jgi:RNA polymerase-binding transcription factor DksA
MSMTAPHRPTPLEPDVLTELRAVLVDAIEANERQADSVPVGPEADAHRVARGSLEDALTRLDGGTYGACTTCGETLPIERLELVPDAEVCMTCVRRPHALYG